MHGSAIARRFPRAAFDEGRLAIRDADWQLINLDTLPRRHPCVVYSGERANAPLATNLVAVEALGTSGLEGVYRLRPQE